MRYLRSKKGMSLVEMLISITILSMAGTALTALFVHSIRGYSLGSSEDAATSTATIAIQKLCNDVRDGKIATISSGMLTVAYPRIIMDTNTGERVYDLSANDPNPRKYYILNGNLVRTVGTTTHILARGISSASFGAQGGTVSVTLTSTEQIGSSTRTHQETARISLRNYRTN